MTSKKAVMLRLHDSTIEQLKNVAEQEHRSLNNLLEVIIADFLKSYEQGEK